MSARLEDLRHLHAAMAFTGRAGSGSCVQRSVALALDLQGRGIVTFGTLRAASPEEVEQLGPNASRVPFIHCWVEVEGSVLAPTTLERTGGRLLPMPRASYYELNAVRDVCPVPRLAFDAIARRFRLASALKHGSARFGDGAITTALLEAAGVRYVVGPLPNLALLPAPQSQSSTTTPRPLQ